MVGSLRRGQGVVQVVEGRRRVHQQRYAAGASAIAIGRRAGAGLRQSPHDEVRSWAEELL